MSGERLRDGALVERLVLANRILAKYGIVDGFGHVSVRVPTGVGTGAATAAGTGDSPPAAGYQGEASTFYLSRSLAPASVTADDILRFDLDGNTLDGDTRTPYLERFIHGEIYRVRPDVISVIHNHSPSVIPFGATRTPLRPIYHMSSFLGSGTKHFEIRDTGGNTDMLVRNRPLGVALAESLGDGTVVLMRGHGCTVVGTSLEQAVYRAIYTEMNARLQKEALAIGEPTYLNEEESTKARATMDATMSRAWERWVAELSEQP